MSSGPIAAVSKEFTRMSKRQKTCRDATNRHVTSLITALEGARDKLKASVAVGGSNGDGEAVPMDTTTTEGTATHLTPDGQVDVATVFAELRSVLPPSDAMSTTLKELHSTISKTGKAIDKNFKADMGAWSVPGVHFDKKLVCQAIAQSLFRQGRFDLGEAFCRECGLEMAQEDIAPFQEMFKVTSAIREHNLQPALDWATSRRAALKKINSSIEFRLHRMQYIHLLSTHGNEPRIPLAYAREQFPRFSDLHMPEIQKLMSCLLYIRRLPSCPYAEMFTASHWSDVEHVFARDACSLLGLSHENPLYITVESGVKALPVLLKLVSLMQSNANSEWQSDSHELPVEINLGPEVQFHSVFACPVSREQTTAENPPVMLPCSHVIARQSMMRLVRQGNHQFKCPYCPSTQSVSQAKQLFF